VAPDHCRPTWALGLVLEFLFVGTVLEGRRQIRALELAFGFFGCRYGAGGRLVGAGIRADARDCGCGPCKPLVDVVEGRGRVLLSVTPMAGLVGPVGSSLSAAKTTDSCSRSQIWPCSRRLAPRAKLRVRVKSIYQMSAVKRMQLRHSHVPLWRRVISVAGQLAPVQHRLKSRCSQKRIPPAGQPAPVEHRHRQLWLCQSLIERRDHQECCRRPPLSGWRLGSKWISLQILALWVLPVAVACWPC
jgi:hypothetical protein